MKKNISINISGIIFHIEEDGYETLRQYLDSVNRYFASFEDSSEILADIESRIAELFLAKLNEGKQVITAEDVQALMATMGNVSDFKAAEEQESAEPSPAAAPASSGRSFSGGQSSSRFERDIKRKVLGGVCAGIGHYFNIDPVWPRLFFALLVLGSYGGLVLLYIILWIVLPGNDKLDEQPSVKKMYRDPEQRVIGGVAAGIAAFFGMDLAIVRILFVVFGIFGVGIITYIILWIVLPEARSITERMQMQGEPVTLSNIESTVKKNLNEKEEEESTFTRIILFPFRLLATILSGLGRIIGPIFNVALEAARIFIGLVLVMLGLGLTLSVLFGFAIMLGFISASAFPSFWGLEPYTSLPIESIREAFSGWLLLFGFLAAIIPTAFLLILGISVIGRKLIINSVVGWTMFVLFFVSVAVLSAMVPALILNYKEQGEVREEKTFAIAGTPVLRLNEVGMNDYRVTDLDLRGYDGNDLKLVLRFEAQGNDIKKAQENAKLVDYTVQQQDSILVFDSNIHFRPDTRFSFQRLDIDLFVPYNRPFAIEPEVWRLIRNYYDVDDMTQTFIIDKNGGLQCISCPNTSPNRVNAPVDQFGLRDFNEIRATAYADLNLVQGDEFAIHLEGSEREKKRYSLSVVGTTLHIDYANRKNRFWEGALLDDNKMKITVTLPNIEKVRFTGAGEVNLRGFREDRLELDLLGALACDARVDVTNLYVTARGPISVELDGEGDYLEASFEKLSNLKANGYEVNRALVEVKEGASARVNVRQRLEIESDLISSVKYSGQPEVMKN